MKAHIWDYIIFFIQKNYLERKTTATLTGKASRVRMAITDKSVTVPLTTICTNSGSTDYSTVIYSCFMGSYQNYHVMVGDTLVKLEEYNPRNKKIYQVGDKAYLQFEHDTVFVL